MLSCGDLTFETMDEVIAHFQKIHGDNFTTKFRCDIPDGTIYLCVFNNCGEDSAGLLLRIIRNGNAISFDVIDKILNKK